MAQLLDQCPEVLHGILQNVEPTDLASLSRSCRHLNDFIKNDDLLWKNHYLSRFDGPISTDNENAEDIVSPWQDRLSKVIALQKLLQSENAEVKNESLDAVAMAVMDLILGSSDDAIKNVSFLSQHFGSESNISSFLCRSSLFTNCRYRDNTPAETQLLQQLSAKLHVFYGLELEPNSQTVCLEDARQVHPYARSRVYDLRRYNRHNLWGPFMDDGSQAIDWEKVQAIMVVLSYNHRMYTERRRQTPASSTTGYLWGQPFHGLAPNSYTSQPLTRPLSPPLRPDLDAQDPYGVTGTWMRVVCFLDYNDLYAFNFESALLPPDQEREPISTREAFRLIRLQLHVTKIEQPGQDDEDEDPRMPIVHFSGTSKSTYMSWDPNANSRIRGSVRTTKSGAIRWTTFSIFHGEERWRSEGVQIGGIRSARGILGNWFDKDYEEQGPAGPTAFWKVSDDIVEDKKRIDVGTNVWQEIVSVVFE